MELRGLRPGAYKVVYYANNKDLGIIQGPDAITPPSRLRECIISCIGARLVSQTHCPSEKSNYKYRSGQLHWVGFTASELAVRLAVRGVLVHPIARNTIRLVTHRDLNRTQCERAARVIGEVVSTLRCETRSEFSH